MDDSDRELLVRAQAGDEAALADLLEAHGPAVRARLSIPAKWASLLTEDDVMQQAYLEAFLHIESFQPRGDGAFRAWLSTIATNVLRDALDWLGAQKRGGGRSRITARSTEESAVALIETLGVEDAAASRDARFREWTQRLHRGLADLPVHYRTVLTEFDLKQRPAEQVAADLGGTVGAMYMLRRRALLKLRSLLGSSPGVPV